MRTQRGLQVSVVQINGREAVPRHSMVVSSCIEILVLECLRSSASSLRIVCRLKRLKIGVVRAVNIKLDGNIGGKIEVGILEN